MIFFGHKKRTIRAIISIHSSPFLCIWSILCLCSRKLPSPLPPALPSSCFGSHQHHHRLHLFPSSLSAPFLLFLFMIAITTITVHLCSSCLSNHHQLHLILLRSPTVVPSLFLCYLLLLHDSIITVPYCSIFAVAVEVVSVAALFGEPLLCCCLVLPSLLLFLQQRRKLLFFCRPSVWR